MKLKQCALYLLAAGMIATGGTALATEQDQGFTALANVETQTLSSQEMQAVTGAALIDNVLAALLKLESSKNPCIAAAATAAYNWLVAHRH